MISFIGLKDRSSMEIRGNQIANKIAGQTIRFGDPPQIVHPQLNQIKQCMIMVRHAANTEHRAALRKCRPDGMLGLDILDLAVGDLLFRNQKFQGMEPYLHNDDFDFYIVNNSAIRMLALEKTSKPCFVIPHHTVNFENKRTCFGEKIKRIGYLGLPEQMDSFDEISEICENLGLEFVVSNEQTHEGCINFLSTLDAGIVYLNEQDAVRSSHIRAFKPNTKLTNFQSFGIPVLCTPYESFKEFGKDVYIPLSDLSSIEVALKRLIDDDELRRDLSNRGYEHAQSFHIDNIASLYRQIPGILNGNSNEIND